MVAKVAGGVIGLGLIGTGSVAMAKPEWFGINKEIPWIPLAQDKNYSESGENPPYKDKFGSEYKNYLTGATGKENEKNDSWWEESLKKLKKDKEASADLGNGFKEAIDKAVKPSGATGDDKYLNEICDTIYKVEKDKVKSTPGSGANDEYKESSVWKYCSPIGQKPTTVQSNHVGTTYEDNNIGKKKEDKLVSVSDTKNDKFWEIRDKEFKNKEGYGPIEENSADAFFKTDLGKTIKQLCEEAYKQNPASGGSSTAKAPTEEKAVKYCSLNKSNN